MLIPPALNVRRLSALAVSVAALASALLLPSFSSAVSVIGDDETERFVGSGAVILPAVVDPATRVFASTCPGCRWKVTAPCRRDDEHGDAGCRGTILGCPQGREINRVWLARPGADFEAVGMFCPSEGEVTSVAEAASRVRGGFERFIPTLAVECAPTRGAVVGIPLHCRSLQPSGNVAWIDSVAGYRVRTSAHARWTWTFVQQPGDGARADRWSHVVTEPGRPFPDKAVRQGFTAPGIHRVEVMARWQGTFTVDGLGPFAVESDLHQRVDLDVPTGSALGVMTSPVRG
jgi:hypothetical protein